jgi:rubrerythrin
MLTDGLKSYKIIISTTTEATMRQLEMTTETKTVFKANYVINGISMDVQDEDKDSLLYVLNKAILRGAEVKAIFEEEVKFIKTLE